MRIDPADPTAVKLTVSHESDDILVRHHRRLMHLLVIRQQPLPTTLVPDEEFAVDEFMAADFIATQESVKLPRIWCAIRQEANPYGRVSEDDHAAAC